MFYTPLHCCHPLVTFVATSGPTLFCTVCTVQSRHFNLSSSNSYQIFIGSWCRPQYIFATNLDPNTFQSLISTWGPGPKGQEWNMTYAANVVVVWGYTIDSHPIDYYQLCMTMVELVQNNFIEWGTMVTRAKAAKGRNPPPMGCKVLQHVWFDCLSWLHIFSGEKIRIYRS